MYVPPRFGDGSFFGGFLGGGEGAMERSLFKSGIHVTLNVDNRGL